MGRSCDLAGVRVPAPGAGRRRGGAWFGARPRPGADVARLEARRVSQSAGARALGPVGWLRAVGRLRRRSARWALQQR